MKQRCYRNIGIEILKFFALLLMAADHIGYLLLDNLPILRIVGRLSFPLFVLIILHSYLYYTRDKKAMIKRLLLFGVLSQIPFSIITSILNIFFTLFLGLLAVYAIENLQSKFYKIAVVGLMVVLGITVDYGPFGVLFIISSYFFLISPGFTTAVLSGIFLSLGNAAFPLGIMLWSGIGMVLAILFFNIAKQTDEVKVPCSVAALLKWFFYLFYPLHLSLLLYLSLP